MKLLQWIALIFLLFCLTDFSLGQVLQSGNEKLESNTPLNGVFIKGVDLSYVNQVEDHGGVFKDRSLVKDPFGLMKEHGANMVRLRLWHNPVWVNEVYADKNSPLYSGFDDVKKSCQRAKAAGMAVNLDFHYSDTWADPAHQDVPGAWVRITSMDVLCDSIYQYTWNTLYRLSNAGLMPEMVQIGNEINCGMLLHHAIDSFPSLNVCNSRWVEQGRIINAGIQAVRDIDRLKNHSTQIALHVADPKNLNWWFGHIIADGLVSDFDVIGLSYYPLWHRTIPFDSIGALVKELKNKFRKKVIVLETAYPWTAEGYDKYPNQFGPDTPVLTGYPMTKEGQNQFLKDLTEILKNSGGDGLMYWEPAWISSQMKDLWGTGSSWENCAWFDFEGNFLNTITYMK